MLRKKTTYMTGMSILVILFLSWIGSVVAQTGSWSDSPITSNYASAPEIDGIKDEVWSSEDANQSYYDFGGPRITLYVLHSDDALYVLVEMKFRASQNEETVSLYIAPFETTEDSDFIDKKQITMYNATQEGNETSEALDLYRDDEGNYIPDNDTDGNTFPGAAKIGENYYRYYEYKLLFSPENTTKDAEIVVSEKITLKVAMNYTATDEQVSAPIVIQVGPEQTLSDSEIGVFNFDKEKYIRIVHYIVIGLIAVYGILIVIGKKYIGDIDTLQRLVNKGKQKKEK